MSNQPSTATTARAFAPATRVQGFGTTVFTEFSAMALQYNAVNLGQGFPNFPAPDFIKRAAQEAIEANLNQYPRGAGQLRLVNALARPMAPSLVANLTRAGNCRHDGCDRGHLCHDARLG